MKLNSVIQTQDVTCLWVKDEGHDFMTFRKVRFDWISSATTYETGTSSSFVHRQGTEVMLENMSLFVFLGFILFNHIKNKDWQRLFIKDKN